MVAYVTRPPTVGAPAEEPAPETRQRDVESRGDGGNTLSYMLSGLAVAAVLLGSLALKRGRAPPKPEDDLDFMILEELRSSGGVMLQAELFRRLGLPRTTVWRRLRRMEERGLLKLVRTRDGTLVTLAG